MFEPSLKSGLWIKAQLRLCDLKLLSAYVAVRGDPDAGAILIKLNLLDGTAKVFTQVSGINGQRSWMHGTGVHAVAEVEADAYISRQVNCDPDLWVLEIEDPRGDYKFDAPVL